MVKMRLEGLPEEVAALIQELRDKGIEVLAESREYPNKGNSYVRVYLDINM